MKLASRIAAIVFLALISGALYIVGTQDANTINGIPVPMAVITIMAPALLIALVFWFARALERNEWQSDDEE